jgi:predicted nucleic acid-binding protein
MKIQRVYIDTSVIGGCFDSEFAKWSNGLMEDFRRGNFKLLLSEVITTEVEDAPNQVQKLYQELLTLAIEKITISDEIADLADAYQQRNILTPKYYDDGLHIAMATVSEADIVASWNFRHMVRFDKIRLFNAVSVEYGYKPIQILSPREVTIYGRD